MRWRKPDYSQAPLLWGIAIALVVFMSFLFSVARFNLDTASAVMHETTPSDPRLANVSDLDTNAVTIIFSHADDDANGNPVKKTIAISDASQNANIPNYEDKDQAIIISGSNKALLNQVRTALKSKGYTDITTL